MEIKNPKSPTALIYDILEQENGVFYSVRELINEIFEKHSYNYSPDTIVKHIDHLKNTGHTIAETYERRGDKRIRTKTFSLIKKTNTECLEK